MNHPLCRTIRPFRDGSEVAAELLQNDAGELAVDVLAHPHRRDAGHDQ